LRGGVEDAIDLQRPSTATWGGPLARARPTVPASADGERLGMYVVERLLGEGGMARVYRARHTTLDRTVAIKRLLPELAGLPEAHGLLLREARIAGSIRHPNVVDIFDFGYDTVGRPYYVMELAAGETLAQRLEGGPLGASQALDIAIEVADVVAAVHATGYVHRDIKADNVMVARVGERLAVKLIDFGIACRVDEPAGRIEGIAGTPRTMAPEQVANDPIDERTDVWGLGVLLYEMLTARLPFEARGSLRDDLLAIVTEAPRPLPDELDGPLCAIVEACLSKEPGGRPAGAAALASELRALRSRQRRRTIVELGPEIADRGDPLGHAAQGEALRPDGAAGDLVPRAGRRHRGPGSRADRVGSSEGGAVAISAGIDEDAAAAVRLRELLREVLRDAPDELGADAMGEACDILDLTDAVECDDDVEPLGAGGLDPAREAELLE